MAEHPDDKLWRRAERRAERVASFKERRRVADPSEVRRQFRHLKDLQRRAGTAEHIAALSGDWDAQELFDTVADALWHASKAPKKQRTEYEIGAEELLKKFLRLHVDDDTRKSLADAYLGMPVGRAPASSPDDLEDLQGLRSAPDAVRNEELAWLLARASRIELSRGNEKGADALAREAWIAAPDDLVAEWDSEESQVLAERADALCRNGLLDPGELEMNDVDVARLVTSSKRVHNLVSNQLSRTRIGVAKVQGNGERLSSPDLRRQELAKTMQKTVMEALGDPRNAEAGGKTGEWMEAFNMMARYWDGGPTVRIPAHVADRFAEIQFDHLNVAVGAGVQFGDSGRATGRSQAAGWSMADSGVGL